MNERIDIGELKLSLTSLNNKKEKLKEIINNELLPLLVELKIDTSEYKTLFSSLYNRFDSISSSLNNGVISNYKGTINNINNLFNNEFSQKMSEILDETSK